MRQPYRVRHAAAETSEEMMTKPVLTVEEVSQLFGLSPHVIRRAVYEHELPADVCGHDILGIKRANLLVWLVRRRGL